jgi:AAA+ ATPase superfamily predicted ATPase
MFLGREYELQFLENIYKRDTGDVVILYSKRRTGKTFLVNQFSRNKPGIYFLALPETKKELIKKFSKKLSEFYHDNVISETPFTSWDAAFEYLIQKTRRNRKKLLIIIDEITNITLSDKLFLSIIWKYYDLHLRNNNIMIILMGSYTSIMSNEILSYSSPLYGKRTEKIKLEELTFYDVYRYFRKIDIRKIIIIYSLFGGLPYYLSLINPDNDIIEQYVNRKNIFHNDAEFILSKELINPERYFTILKLIANRNNNMSQIANIMDVKPYEISAYLDKLISMDLIKKEYSLYNNKRNNGRYRINGNYFNFYFRFIFDEQEYFNNSQESIIKEIINSNLDEYISEIFKNICIGFLKLYSNKIINSYIVEIGSWWIKNKATENDREEIDIIGKDSLNRYIFSDILYENSGSGIAALEELKRKSGIFGFDNKLYILFSLHDFDKDLINISEIENNVILVNIKQMVAILDKSLT